MRYRLLAAAAAVTLLAGVASAAPKAARPTVEVRLRSVNDLVDKFEYVAPLVGQENAVEQVREFIKMLSTDGKGIEGVDPKQPSGAYATVAKDIGNSPVVVMIPIADETQFLKALKTRLDITPEKSDDGTRKINVPNIDELHLRFANGYLYVARKASELDPKQLIKPKDFFANDDGSVASAVVHLDRIPADLKTFVTGQLELNLNEERKKNADTENATEKKLKNLVLDTVLTAVKGLADDGKELTVRLFVDPKGDDISGEFTLTAKNGSPAAKYFASLGGKKSLSAGIVGTAAPKPAARGSMKLAVTEGMKKEYAAAIDAMLADAVKNAPEGQEELIKQLVAVVSPTLKAGTLDAAGALVGPDAKGRYQVVGALAVKDGKEIEKFVKKTIEDYGQFIEGAVKFKFDVETVGDFNLHRVDLQDVDEKFEKLFGTKTIWLAISDTHIAFSIEPNGITLRKGLKAKAVAAPVMAGEVALAQLIPLIQPDVKPDELKAMLKDTFGNGPATGKDTIAFTVAGGDKLTVKFKMKGKALRLGTSLGTLKGE